MRKMKQSGIEWIGEIPEEWEVRRIKFLLRRNLQYGTNESGILFDEKLSLTNEQSKDFLLEENDILFARSGATVGKSFIYKKEYGKAGFAGYLIRAQLNSSVNTSFFYLYTLLSLYETWKNGIFIQATIQNIGADKYSNLPVILPSLFEQQEIVEYLDTKCFAIDSTISQKQH